MKALRKVLLLMVIFVCVPVFSVFGEELAKTGELKVADAVVAGDSE